MDYVNVHATRLINKMTCCDNCNQIVETEYVSLVAPTMFGDIDFEGRICLQCKSLIEYSIYQYSELFERLTKEMNHRAMKLNLKIKKEMK